MNFWGRGFDTGPSAFSTQLSTENGPKGPDYAWDWENICDCLATLDKDAEMDPRVSSSLEDKNPGEPPEVRPEDDNTARV